jgi:transposase-like protein
MKLLEFNNLFPDAASCELHWKEQREEQGIVCKQCGGVHHVWKEKWRFWVCVDCYFRTSLRCGTIMESSHLPIRQWYMAMHFLTCTKHAFSAKELQRELGRKRYEPVWAMMHKLRYAMGKRDGEYELEDFVEFDDAFFSTFQHKTKKEEREEREEIQKEPEQLKRGKGSQKKSKVMVMAESIPATIEEQKAGKYSKSRKLGHIKMLVVEDLKKDTITDLVEENINENSVVMTDGSNSFVDIKTKVKEHQFEILKSSEDVNRYLPWVHTMIANAKRAFLGIHYLIGKGYLQQYLNEFCFNINRRFFGVSIFDRLVYAGIQCKHYQIKDIRYEFLQKNG